MNHRDTVYRLIDFFLTPLIFRMILEFCVCGYKYAFKQNFFPSPWCAVCKYWIEAVCKQVIRTLFQEEHLVEILTDFTAHKLRIDGFTKMDSLLFEFAAMASQPVNLTLLEADCKTDKNLIQFRLLPPSSTECESSSDYCREIIQMCFFKKVFAIDSLLHMFVKNKIKKCNV